MIFSNVNGSLAFHLHRSSSFIEQSYRNDNFRFVLFRKCYLTLKAQNISPHQIVEWVQIETVYYSVMLLHLNWLFYLCFALGLDADKRRFCSWKHSQYRCKYEFGWDMIAFCALFTYWNFISFEAAKQHQLQQWFRQRTHIKIQCQQKSRKQ